MKDNKVLHFAVLFLFIGFVFFYWTVPLTDDIEEVGIVPATRVYLGGHTVGFNIENDGVLVLGKSNVQTGEGAKTLIEDELAAGDIIKSVNGITVNKTKDIFAIINSRPDNGEVLISAVRKNKEFEVRLKPSYDVLAKKYKLGLWVKDDASGIGTLTYVREDNLRFGALGHPISDSATGVAADARSGIVYPCEVMGINRGGRGAPGELRGLILKGKAEQGSISKNNKHGVFGNLKSDSVFLNPTRLLEVGGRAAVKPGKAKIYSSIEGTKVEEFDIEIIKTNYQASSNEKSLVFRVVDKGLISRTGGIVQGMSGSPIVQNGKLVGAVTHVFVNDPTKGFGIYIDWMLNE
ncbi:MAG: SpoIVB peptidase [Firmicutes bacterium]|nr:SpoIVB peptidase [Bacillota bacterium]